MLRSLPAGSAEEKGFEPLDDLRRRRFSKASPNSAGTTSYVNLRWVTAQKNRRLPIRAEMGVGNTWLVGNRHVRAPPLPLAQAGPTNDSNGALTVRGHHAPRMRDTRLEDLRTLH
jgi:hypothetical protein